MESAKKEVIELTNNFHKLHHGRRQGDIHFESIVHHRLFLRFGRLWTKLHIIAAIFANGVMGHDHGVMDHSHLIIIVLLGRDFVTVRSCGLAVLLPPD